MIQIDTMYSYFFLSSQHSKLLYLFLPFLFYVLDSTRWKGGYVYYENHKKEDRKKSSSRLLRIIFRGFEDYSAILDME